MITESERSRILAVALCGPRVVQRLESIGVTKLSDLRGRDAQDLMHEINDRPSRLILRHADVTVDAAAMHAVGHAFYQAANGVWLTDHVPPGDLSGWPG